MEIGKHRWIYHLDDSGEEGFKCACGAWTTSERPPQSPCSLMFSSRPNTHSGRHVQASRETPKMTRDEARIFLLEEALIQSRHTIYFLHMCLTPGSGYSYTYPEQTLQQLAAIDALVDIPKGCAHGGPRPGRECAACEDTLNRHIKRIEANEVLKNDKE